jgi:hypothetical protein
VEEWSGHAKRADPLPAGWTMTGGDDLPGHGFPAVESRLDYLIELARRSGGFTVDPRDGSLPTTGFVVATGRATALIESAARFFGGNGPTALRTYVRDKGVALRGDPALLLGAWHDRPGQRVVLSLVELVSDRAAATRLAVSNRQWSIYDLSAGSEVPTGYTGGR